MNVCYKQIVQSSVHKNNCDVINMNLNRTKCDIRCEYCRGGAVVSQCFASHGVCE